jgi:hypothetical protein
MVLGSSITVRAISMGKMITRDNWAVIEVILGASCNSGSSSLKTLAKYVIFAADQNIKTCQRVDVLATKH